MRALRRLRALPPAERRLVLEAGALLAALRLALWLVPFAGARRLARGLGRARRDAASRARPDEARIVWAVEAAARAVPRSTCLVQALAARALLARYGYPGELRLGVARGPEGKFLAHAWIECDGRVLIGGAVTERYVALPSIERSG